MKRFIRFAAIGLIAWSCLTTLATAASNGIEDRIRHAFPLAGSAAGLPEAGRPDRFQPVALGTASADGDRFATAQFADAYRLEKDGLVVVLRPLGAEESTARRESSGVSYEGAFQFVDAFRTFEGGADREVLLLNARQAAVAYQVVETSGVAEIVNDGRGVRFVSTGPAHDLLISAPLLVDSSGRPSSGAKWRIERIGSAVILRLRITDRALRYPVAVVYGAGATLNATRVLHPAPLASGAISGTVSSSANNAGLNGAVVYVFDSNGQFVTLANTNSNGSYTAGGLGTGSYRALFNAGGYTPQLYNNIACPDFSCDVAGGTAINVTDGATTSGINAALVSNTTQITGSVTDNNSVAFGDVTLVAYDGSGTPVGSATSDEVTGNYQITLDTGGTYFVRTFNTTHPGYGDQLYSGINCSDCVVTSGTPIVVANGGVAGGKNFALQPGGRIAGHVTDAFSNALPFARITVFDSTGVAVSFSDTDANGNYLTVTGLAAGNYFVTASSGAFVTQVYNGIACPSCNPTTGTAVPVAFGQTTSGINFALSGAQVRATGKVLDALSGAPLFGIGVIFHDSSGQQVITTETDGTGKFSVVLPRAGTFFARTFNQVLAGYVDQLYSATDCSGCDPTKGQPINIAIGVPATEINFSLSKNGGSITGTIRDGSSGSPVGSAVVQVYGPTGLLAANGSTNSSGQFTLFQGLASGSYFVVASAPQFIRDLYQNITCNACDVTGGTAVAVTRGQTTSSINFNLATTNAHVKGLVRAASNASALAGVSVLVFDAHDNIVGSATTDTTGAYDALLPNGGTFFAVTQNTVFAQYGDQLWDHITCNGCDPISGTAIVVADGSTVSNINFDLVSAACPTITLSPQTLPNAVVNTAYSQTVTASGGAAPYTFVISEGTLPAGLTLSSTGTISGTPTAIGSSSFSIRVTDANGCPGSDNFSIDVTASTSQTSLTATPNPSVYGQPVTLTATVTPSTATGNVQFKHGNNVLGTVPLSGGTATLVISTLSAGVNTLIASYGGSNDFAPSSSTEVNLVVQKATPTIIWNNPAPIDYGTPLSATQLNASISGNVPGTFVYSPTAGTVLNAGAQTLSVTFSPTDTDNYDDASKSVTLVVNKIDQNIVWANPADITYGTPLGPAQLNATVVVTPGLSPAGALTYNPPAGTVLDAGTQTLTVTAAATVNYKETSRSVTINVLKLTPVFSNLSAPVIVVGTSSTTISGKITAGAFVPPGNVVIRLNGVSQTAVIHPDGTFSSAFVTSLLTPNGSGYPITFTYPGSTNFNTVSATSQLVVTFAFTGGLLPPGPSNAGSTVVFRIQIVDVNESNLSSNNLVVTAYGVKLQTSPTWGPVDASGNNNTTQFRFQNAQGGSYMFNLKTDRALAPGDYFLGFTVAGDPVIHTTPFTIR